MTKKDPHHKEIELLRKRMAKIALEKGLTSVESVKISQELDTLLNEIQKHRTK